MANQISVPRERERVLIQKIKPEVMKHYKQISCSAHLKDDTFYVKKSTKVKPRALINNLEVLKRDKSEELINAINGVISDVEDMFSDGGCRMYIRHTAGRGNAVEFVCVAVYKYMVERKEAVDYLISFFSHKEKRYVARIGNAMDELRGTAYNAVLQEPAQVRDMIEANFIYELVGREYAKLENDKIFMFIED
ncbi:unnamed protein product [Auanema sp. JU1783]|nr:unnamed protein product [Auanema sp. JU1783]